MSEHTEKNMAGIDLGILLGDLLRVGHRVQLDAGEGTLRYL